MKRCLFVNRKNKLHFIGKISFLLNNNYTCAVIVVKYVCVHVIYMYVIYIYVLYYIHSTYHRHTILFLTYFCIVSICYEHVINMPM